MLMPGKNPNETGSAAAANRSLVWGFALALILVTLFVYWPATTHDFLNYDDQDYVASNDQVQKGLTAASIKWAFAHPVVGNWLPLTMMSHMLDCQWYGLKPWGHHLTSILLHALNTALVFLFLCRITGALWRSLAVAALFGLHPLHVESVAWVAERKDVLSTFFGLLCLLAYAGYAQKIKLQNPPQKMINPASLNYWLALLFLALGLMSKPMLVTMPFVLLLLDYWPLRRFNPSTIKFLLLEKIPFFLLAAAASVATWLIQQRGGLMQSVQDLPPGFRFENALIAYCRYLGKLFWPADLTVFYPYPGHWPVGQVLLAGLALVGITAFVFAQRERYPFLLVGWLWFCGTLVPVIGLVQVGAQSLADRYTYIPSVGLFVAVVWGAYALLKRIPQHPIALATAGCLVIITCTGMTRQQLGYWQNNETLYRHALAVSDKNYLAYHNLGIALYKKGDIDGAISEYEQALSIHPDYPVAHYDLGTALGMKGRTQDAIAEFQQAIRLQPDYADAYSNLGTALCRVGQTDDALAAFQQAARLAPGKPEYHYDLGTLLGMKGQIDSAIAQFQEAIRLKPDYTAAQHNLAYALQIKNAGGAARPQTPP
jgi:Flp pilus assembly protein TadD